MESDPKITNEEQEEEGVIHYERMGAVERGINVLANFLEGRLAKREAKDQAKRERKFRNKPEFDWHIKQEQEKKAEVARNLAQVNAARVEKAGVVGGGKEKTVGESIWTLMWGTPLVYVASKHEKMKANAKNTLLEPFRIKSLGNLFKKIGREMK